MLRRQSPNRLDQWGALGGQPKFIAKVELAPHDQPLYLAQQKTLLTYQTYLFQPATLAQHFFELIHLWISMSKSTLPSSVFRHLRSTALV